MERETVKIHEKEDLGVVQISKEVVAVIASHAAIEVDGVAGMVGDLRGDIVELLGMKNLAKGVVVEVEEDIVEVSMAVVIEMGVALVDCSQAIQERVKNAIENMTGLTVSTVNLNIAGVKVEQ